MLTDEEKREIAAEFPLYPYRQAVALDALQIVQRHRGWISDESLRDIAEFLGMSVGELDGLATFYNLIYRRPVGRHVIKICDSVSCWILGCEGLRDCISRKLGIQMGETTPDGRLTLLPIVCLGACDRAPVMMVDSDLHLDVDQNKIDSILESYE